MKSNPFIDAPKMRRADLAFGLDPTPHKKTLIN